jgi:hypothetical protein
MASEEVRWGAVWGSTAGHSKAQLSSRVAAEAEAQGAPLLGALSLRCRDSGRLALLGRHYLFFLIDTVYHPLTGVLTGALLPFRL